MRGLAATWRGIRALCASLIVALSLAAAPATLAVNHGPGALAAEADHRAYHAEHGNVHNMPGSHHHDSSDHDHVGAALLTAPGAEFSPAPQRTLRPDTLVADGTIRDALRRPPRLTVI